MHIYIYINVCMYVCMYAYVNIYVRKCVFITCVCVCM